jgi:hypothetical protein
VPHANNIKKSPVSPEKTNCEKMEKKNALNPKAAKGNAVAVPLWCGQFNAEVFIAAANAAQPPRPVEAEKKHRSGIDPSPRT